MKPSLPQGTRDFNAHTLHKRNYIFNTIKNVFKLYGFEPLETPAMENLETLTGKYGDEGDKLIFKIINNGLDNAAKREEVQQGFNALLNGRSSNAITERALRYDLTIPFARYVAMNYGQLTFPFKRYQIQPVWRADRPQKGRYREFYQCDADIIGSNSLLNEVELANIYIDVFKKLNIDVELKINNRKILTALAEICNKSESLTDITVAIDKLDKVGIDKVKDELKQRNLNEDQISIIEKYLLIKGSKEEKLNTAKNLFGENITAKKGIEEIEFLLHYNSSFPVHHSPLTIDFTLARGLNYYTGMIFEVKAKDVQIGSIGGGGRYDDLTGLFGVPNVSGVGISFGVDRIYDVMQELKLFPDTLESEIQVLFFNLGEAESNASYILMQQLRAGNIKCEMYHEQAKFDKQFKYAAKKHIAYAVIIGSKELTENSCVIKNFSTGEQKNISQDELITFNFI